MPLYFRWYALKFANVHISKKINKEQVHFLIERLWKKNESVVLILGDPLKSK